MVTRKDNNYNYLSSRIKVSQFYKSKTQNLVSNRKIAHNIFTNKIANSNQNINTEVKIYILKLIIL